MGDRLAGILDLFHIVTPLYQQFINIIFVYHLSEMPVNKANYALFDMD